MHGPPQSSLPHCRASSHSKISGAADWPFCPDMQLGDNRLVLGVAEMCGICACCGRLVSNVMDSCWL